MANRQLSGPLKEFAEADPNGWENIEAYPAMAECFLKHANQPAGAFIIANQLAEICTELDMRWHDGPTSSAQRAWNQIAHYFVATGHLPHALVILESLYHQLLRFQTKSGQWIHKGQPLIKISDCYLHLNYPVHSKRYFMYTLCDDAIDRKGPRYEGSGVYGRISWHGISEELATEYHHSVYQKATELGEDAWFPERLLTELDRRHLRWMTEYPTAQEYGTYRSNPLYIHHLLDQLGTNQGKTLERLAHYLVSMIPGARVYHRRMTPSSDFDVVGSLEGPGLDFRSELGRYFLCECKDWDNAADVTVVAKLAYFLDSVKSRFGILFSKKGTTGNKMRDAEHEQLKVYANQGIAIVVIDKNDLENVAKGYSFLSMLRTRYEKVRLDIAETQSDDDAEEETPANLKAKQKTDSPSSKPSKGPKTKKKGPEKK